MALRYHIRGESGLIHFRFEIRNLASIVDPADDRMPDTENSYEAAYN
jgi:hypothetical protein